MVIEPSFSEEEERRRVVWLCRDNCSRAAKDTQYAMEMIQSSVDWQKYLADNQGRFQSPQRRIDDCKTPQGEF
ncbi:MAG: hypothetical protein ACKOUR_19545, partial [Planctomycetota bacterium]